MDLLNDSIHRVDEHTEFKNNQERCTVTGKKYQPKDHHAAAFFQQRQSERAHKGDNKPSTLLPVLDIPILFLLQSAARSETRRKPNMRSVCNALSQEYQYKH